MQATLQAARATRLVLGISGGVDSCTLGKLAQLVVDEFNEQQPGAYEFIAVRLPYGKCAPWPATWAHLKASCRKRLPPTLKTSTCKKRMKVRRA